MPKDEKLFEYDDGLPPAWVCLIVVLTMPFWLPFALVAAMLCRWRAL